MSELQTKLLTDTWIDCTWNEFIAAIENPVYEKAVVSQKQGSGKVEKLKTPTRLSHVCSCPIQMATLSA